MAKGERKMSAMQRFLRNESGATAIEYGVIAGSLSIAILGAVSTLGVTVKGNYAAIAQLFR
jgi:pilus assembly protein Flp/PilA